MSEQPNLLDLPLEALPSIPKTTTNATEPMGILTMLSAFSPVILACCVTSMSFLFQNFKGLIYLAFLLGASLMRSLMYMYNGAKANANEGGEGCNPVQFTKYGNNTFSSFVFAFTFMYLIIPMFLNKNMNYWLFSAMLIFFFIDCFIKYYKKCVPQTGDLVLNVLAGLAVASLIISMMYAGGSGQFLFFNEVSAAEGREICYQPKEQSFKCQVYKNGELIGSV